MVKSTTRVVVHVLQRVIQHLLRAQHSVFQDASVLGTRFFIITSAYHAVSVLQFNSVRMVKCTRHVVVHALRHVIQHLHFALYSVFRAVSVPMVWSFITINVYYLRIVLNFNIPSRNTLKACTDLYSNKLNLQ